MNQSSVNFDTGARGSTIKHPDGFHLMYGNLQVNDDNNWFEVSNPRSMIADLGKKKWEQFEKPGSLPKMKPRKTPEKTTHGSGWIVTYSLPTWVKKTL